MALSPPSFPLNDLRRLTQVSNTVNTIGITETEKHLLPSKRCSKHKSYMTYTYLRTRIVLYTPRHHYIPSFLFTTTTTSPTQRKTYTASLLRLTRIVAFMGGILFRPNQKLSGRRSSRSMS